ncbi:hypothetical protein Tco_0730228 [Tanacetum coccineum]|uniref:Uncharacterized protein n=1 Tax=Tanacetum coccineum TaxID=301880 RepID=A0ABQ4YTX1_9ASTR
MALATAPVAAPLAATNLGYDMWRRLANASLPRVILTPLHLQVQVRAIRGCRRALQVAFAELACNVERYIAQHSCSWCGGTFNGRNCPGCSSVESGNEFVYDPNPCSYNETPNFFNQPSQHQYKTYSCELCRDSPHYGSDCQTRTPLVYEQDLCSSQNFSNDQSPYYSMSLPQQFHCREYCGGLHDIPELSMMMNFGTPTPEPLVNSFVYKESDNDIEVTPAYTPSLPFLTTMEPADTLLMGDEVISTTPAMENDELIKSSVDDLVPIPREFEVTSNREHVVDFLMENEDIADLPRHLFKQLFSYLVKHPSSTKRMSDEPLGDDLKLRSYDEFEDISSLDPPNSAPLNYESLGNPDSVFRSLETSDLNLEELIAKIGLDDSIPIEIDDGYYDSEGDILFLEHLLIEETFFDPTPAVLPKKSTLLVTPTPTSKQSSLREVERFDPFFSLTQSGRKTRVIETPSFGFHHMRSPRLAAYSPKEIPSDESKVHVEVLSVLWGNRLLIPDGSLPLSRPIRRIQDFDESKDHCLTLKNTPYPHQQFAVCNSLVNEEEQYGFTQYAVSIKKIRRIRACTHQRPQKKQAQYAVKMDNPNITMEEYIRLEEEKARRRAIVFNDTLTSEVTLSCEPTVSSLNNDEIDFRISFNESE